MRIVTRNALRVTGGTDSHTSKNENLSSLHPLRFSYKY